MPEDLDEESALAEILSTRCLYDEAPSSLAPFDLFVHQTILDPIGILCWPQTRKGGTFCTDGCWTL
eukprot:4139895-Amphidinium_carterae.1